MCIIYIYIYIHTRVLGSGMSLQRGTAWVASLLWHVLQGRQLYVAARKSQYMLNTQTLTRQAL